MKYSRKEAIVIFLKMVPIVPVVDSVLQRIWSPYDFLPWFFNLYEQETALSLSLNLVLQTYWHSLRFY